MPIKLVALTQATRKPKPVPPSLPSPPSEPMQIVEPVQVEEIKLTRWQRFKAWLQRVKDRLNVS